LDIAALRLWAFWTRSGVEVESHLAENVARPDAPLSPELSKLLGIGRRARLLSREEHEYTPLRRELGLKAVEPVTDARSDHARTCSDGLGTPVTITMLRSLASPGVNHAHSAASKAGVNIHQASRQWLRRF
jgi:hypothetical protein